MLCFALKKIIEIMQIKIVSGVAIEIISPTISAKKC
jgi:hypothetical protein